MVDGSLEQNRGRRVGIVVGESEAEFEGQASVGSVVGTFNGSSPGEQVAIRRREGGNAWRRRHHELHQLILKSMRCQSVIYEEPKLVARDGSTSWWCSEGRLDERH